MADTASKPGSPGGRPRTRRSIVSGVRALKIPMMFAKDAAPPKPHRSQKEAASAVLAEAVTEKKAREETEAQKKQRKFEEIQAAKAEAEEKAVAEAASASRTAAAVLSPEPVTPAYIDPLAGAVDHSRGLSSSDPLAGAVDHTAAVDRSPARSTPPPSTARRRGRPPPPSTHSPARSITRRPAAKSVRRSTLLRGLWTTQSGRRHGRWRRRRAGRLWQAEACDLAGSAACARGERSGRAGAAPKRKSLIATGVDLLRRSTGGARARHRRRASNATATATATARHRRRRG